MDQRYSDSQSAVESLREIEDEAEDGDSGKLIVLDTDQIRIVAADDEEMDDRNLWSQLNRVDDQICCINWDANRFGSLLLRLSFHQSEVENRFTLDIAQRDAIAPKQATDPRNLGSRLQTALHPFIEECNASFTFTGVDAASMSNGGHFTDFEFEYAIDLMSLDA